MSLSIKCGIIIDTTQMYIDNKGKNNHKVMKTCTLQRV